MAEPNRRVVKRRHGFCDRWRHGLRDRWRRCTAIAFRSDQIRVASPTATNCRRYRGSTAKQSSPFDSIRRAVKRRQHVAAGLAPQSQSPPPIRRAVKRRHGFSAQLQNNRWIKKRTWAYRLSVSPGWNYESLANTAEIIHRFGTSRVEAACPGQPAGMLGRLTPLASTE